MWERFILDMFNGYMQTMVDVMTWFFAKLGDLGTEFVKTSAFVIGAVLAIGAVGGLICTAIIIKGTIL